MFNLHNIIPYYNTLMVNYYAYYCKVLMQCVLQIAQRCHRHHCKRWSSSMATTFPSDCTEQKQISRKPAYDESGKKNYLKYHN